MNFSHLYIRVSLFLKVLNIINVVNLTYQMALKWPYPVVDNSIYYFFCFNLKKLKITNSKAVLTVIMFYIIAIVDVFKILNFKLNFKFKVEVYFKFISVF